MSHQCPGPSCNADVPDHMLMCRRHWYKVPRDIRTWVWNSWAGGTGSGSADHRHAMVAAIEAIQPPVPDSVDEFLNHPEMGVRRERPSDHD